MKRERKEAERVQAQEKYERFRDWLNHYKMERGCADCGYCLHPAALDLDHVDPGQKRFAIAQAAFRNRDDVLRELAQCEVVCACCHRIRSWDAMRDGRIKAGRPRIERDPLRLDL